MHEWQSQSHVRWECKYHVCDHTEVPPESLLRKAESGPQPPTGATSWGRPPRGAFLKPRPLAVDPYLQCNQEPNFMESFGLGQLRSANQAPL